MILTCNSCGKRFVVPDSAITAAGRMVQCGSCGNKWKQFPVEEIKETQPTPRSKKEVSIPKPVKQKKQITKKIKRVLRKNLERLVYTHLNI